MIVAAAAALTAVLLNFDFGLFEAKLYDLRMSVGYQPKPDSRIVLVTLDHATTKALDEFSPLTLDVHTRFLEQIEKLGPQGLGYLIDFNRVRETNPDIQKEWALKFLETANRIQSRGTKLMLGTPYDVTGEIVPPYPLGSLPHAIAVVHKDGNVFAEDKVTRRALLELNDKPVFHLDFARRLSLLGETQLPRGAYQVPQVDGRYFFFRYHGNTAYHAGQATKLPYPSISFLDILQGKLAPGALAGKIVLIGTLSKEDWSDYAYTPFSREPFVNSKLVVHANILDSVIRQDGVMLAPSWVNVLITFAVVTFVLSWVVSSSPIVGLVSTIGLGFVFILFATVLFQSEGFWLRIAEPLVGILLSYYLAVPYRLIREYQKRWDYQRKNALLTQVEELKTNFLSLVTHDLKTPVARIQGLAEVLQRKAADRLVDRDMETLRSIIGSTEELNHFISSILELSKIESNRIKLAPESKDINQLIERAVDGFKAAARARGITLTAELEPLFPIKIDSSLIFKVINTLLDNALKYSPENSEIRISSREQGDWVEVAVSDQGIGMSSEECENLFTRFYRAKNETTAKVSGTGLGLYLTKYFIEAHHGRVEFDSEPGHGSTFKIFLPLVPPAMGAASGADVEVNKVPAWNRMWKREKEKSYV